jgi:protein-S-isoprenylcysteine O-methyltransferase Ste14
MPAVSPARRILVGLITASGAALFAWALASTLLAYSGRFGQSPGEWSFARGLQAATADALAFLVFAVHHSVFARKKVREWVASVVTADLERSVYVWTASLLLLGVVWWWQPVPGVAWAASGPLAGLLVAIQCSGVVVTLIAAAEVGLLRLSGLRPDDRQDTLPPLKSTGLYGFVRHPIYFAWVLMVWPTPLMTGSRLTFAILTTAYLVVAVPFEERSLRQTFGRAYDDYRARVRWRMLPGLY